MDIKGDTNNDSIVKKYKCNNLKCKKNNIEMRQNLKYDYNKKIINLYCKNCNEINFIIIKR
jgi:hypothetical protein